MQCVRTRVNDNAVLTVNGVIKTISNMQFSSNPAGKRCSGARRYLQRLKMTF